MDDPENLDYKYFIDYFGNKVHLGDIGINRTYDSSDYIGMSKSCAMDIAEEQLQTIIINEPNFNTWFNLQHKYYTLYTSIHIYLHEPHYDTNTLVRDWFRELYIMKTSAYEYR